MANSKLRHGRFNEEQDKAFQDYLDATGKSEASVIRDAVMLYIKRPDLVGTMRRPGRPQEPWLPCTECG